MRRVAVVPAFNEEGHIGVVIERLRPVVDDIIVVDDGSRDATAERARNAGAFVISHIINRGQGAALQTGTDVALARGADIIIHFDADGQHDVVDLGALTKPLEEGQADISLGSRFLGGAPNLPVMRRIILKLGRVFIWMFSGLWLTDSQNGLRAMTRDTARRLRVTHDGMAHASQILDEIAEQHLRFVEVPVTIRYTAYSLSRGQGSANAFRIAWKLITEKFF